MAYSDAYYICSVLIKDLLMDIVLSSVETLLLGGEKKV